MINALIIAVTLFYSTFSFSKSTDDKREELIKISSDINNIYPGKPKLFSKISQTRRMISNLSNKISAFPSKENLSDTNESIMSELEAEKKGLLTTVSQLEAKYESIEKNERSLKRKQRLLLKEIWEESKEEIYQTSTNATTYNLTPENESFLQQDYNLDLFKKYCEEYNMLKNTKSFKEIRHLKDLCQVTLQVSHSGLVEGIEIKNNTQNESNPRGDLNAFRKYSFSFEDRLKVNTYLMIEDNPAHVDQRAGYPKVTHNQMFTHMIFIPRLTVPYVEKEDGCIECNKRVYLPTGEFVNLNKFTNEIVSGILSHESMDISKSRHRRNFAEIKYSGRGITITTKSRGKHPQRIQLDKNGNPVSWNDNEDVTHSTINYQGKTCRVHKSKLWENTTNELEKAIFKFPTDEKFIDEIANDICGWNITIEDLM